MAIQYLFDENVDPNYFTQLRRRNPDIVILAIGELTAPLRGTLDPEILIWCETHNFILITNNRRSMPIHLANHLTKGYHIPGIFILNPKLSIGENLDELQLIAEASFDDEYHTPYSPHTTALIQIYFPSRIIYVNHSNTNQNQSGTIIPMLGVPVNPG